MDNLRYPIDIPYQKSFIVTSSGGLQLLSFGTGMPHTMEPADVPLMTRGSRPFK